jgi:hypothetical protein
MYDARKYTNKLIELMDKGLIGSDALARRLLAWSDEDTIKRFYDDYGYEVFESEEDE